MNTNNSNVPIYPIPHPSSEYDYFGLTKREYFAAMAMQGLLAANQPMPITESMDGYLKTLSVTSVLAADALIAELNK